MTERLTRTIGRSDGGRELVEGRAEPLTGGDVGGEFIVAAAEILHEGVTGGQDPRRPAALQASHRAQSRHQPAMVIRRLSGSQEAARSSSVWQAAPASR